MAFDSLADFFAMGGHALYVWLAYGATYLVLATLAWHSLTGHRKQRQLLRQQRKRLQSQAQAEPQS